LHVFALILKSRDGWFGCMDDSWTMHWPERQKPFSIMHFGAGQASLLCFLGAAGYEWFGENTVQTNVRFKRLPLSFRSSMVLQWGGVLLTQDPFAGLQLNSLGWCRKKKGKNCKSIKF
jgi:hypothetical protein